MEQASWDPQKPLGKDAVKLCDPAIYERLARARAIVGDRPAYLDDALSHCSKPFLLRDTARSELSVDFVERERAPFVERPRYAPAELLGKLASREAGEVRLGSQTSQRAHRAVRALYRVLLRQPVRW